MYMCIRVIGFAKSVECVVDQGENIGDGNLNNSASEVHF